ncbi:guanosine polyphosphate pyrophosphohydrolase [[Brevibacterium] flavum]|uniref:Guanosine polyphosphate pyrophosphohydrolase n=1 Tax=[Brevibacterium] flavum TaxID=92706 RepID=A0A0F6Z5B9_9CORY|nr:MULTISPECIES: HD domain-containing protein [Corynebacterium]AKF27310.1 guanosine polyphosphate pyrophosphohydrolase [[Brevibacterium] flavum]ANE08133.1 guanosine polyphosphate pyrophosphohydrolase [Corynebacterium glutamicum]AST20556.1 bifunctional (p)ppGpp synthetase/guanosine-3',5'-bis(diphosphate) 3'-pyrophosphohydrolase [Corynebacterium glutamicum ATCC 14067]KEI23046.1 guanosine polyphosphate pyrophosphohydrolase [Corynebacterium glutamicum ATCC 14067]KIH73935.1 guanosine polyphosphate 
MNTLSPRLRKAMNTAAWAHRHHVRKGGGIPYVSHLYSVMYLLASVTNDEDVLIAGLLHDTLEDVPEEYNSAQLEADFGPRVRGLVEELTKQPLKSWKARADAYLLHLSAGASLEAVLISTADKLHNLMSILDDLEIHGEDLWQRFNASKEQQIWWYSEVYQISLQRLGFNELNKQLGWCVEKLLKQSA